jgi:hypothetical protein
MDKVQIIDCGKKMFYFLTTNISQGNARTSLDFEFLSDSALTSMELTELKGTVKYNKEPHASEFYLGAECFKHQAQNLFPEVESATTLGLCQLTEDYAPWGLVSK